MVDLNTKAWNLNVAIKKLVRLGDFTDSLYRVVNESNDFVLYIPTTDSIVEPKVTFNSGKGKIVDYTINLDEDND